MNIDIKKLVQTDFLAFAMKAFASLNKGRKRMARTLPTKLPTPFATFCAVNGISRLSTPGYKKIGLSSWTL